jgi:hypothetical protein
MRLLNVTVDDYRSECDCYIAEVCSFAVSCQDEQCLRMTYGPPSKLVQLVAN